MLTDKFKEEALNKLENMSTDELVDNLKFVESELDTQYLNKGDINKFVKPASKSALKSTNYMKINIDNIISINNKEA